MKKFSLFTILFVTLLTIIAFTIPIQGTSDANVLAPRIQVREGTSTNCSGYAIPATTSKKGQTTSVTDVQGWWIVPTSYADPTKANSFNAWSSNWVGIDGYSSSSVEQLGTESDWYNGAPRYYAWWEMYPKPSYLINQTVAAGDYMFGEVKYSNGNFILTLKDYGPSVIDMANPPANKWGFTLTQKSGKAALSSAEWVVEAPWSGGVLPLTNFKTTYFYNSKATIGANTAPIGGFSNFDRMDMVVSNTKPYTYKDLTSNLGNDNASFNVAWRQSQ